MIKLLHKWKVIFQVQNPNNNKWFLSGQWVTFSQKLVHPFCLNFSTSCLMPQMRFLKRFYEIPLTNKKVMAKNVKFCYCVSAPVPVRVSEHESSLASTSNKYGFFYENAKLLTFVFSLSYPRTMEGISKYFFVNQTHWEMIQWNGYYFAHFRNGSVKRLREYVNEVSAATFELSK